MIMFFQEYYEALEPESHPLLYVYILITMVGIFMTIRLFQRWRERKKLTAQWLFFAFLAITISIIGLTLGFLEGVITGEKQELYKFSLAFGYTGLMIFNIFLLLFAMEVFTLKNRKYLIKYIIGFVLIAIAVALPWNYYGLPADHPARNAFPSIRMYSSAAMMILSLLIYVKIYLEAIRISKMVDEPWSKRGFQFIGYSQLCIILFFVMMLLDTILFTISEDITGYTIFIYFAWLFAGGFLIFSYLGLIMPQWLRNLLEQKKSKPEVINE